MMFVNVKFLLMKIILPEVKVIIKYFMKWKNVSFHFNDMTFILKCVHVKENAANFAMFFAFFLCVEFYYTLIM